MASSHQIPVPIRVASSKNVDFGSGGCVTIGNNNNNNVVTATSTIDASGLDFLMDLPLPQLPQLQDLDLDLFDSFLAAETRPRCNTWAGRSATPPSISVSPPLFLSSHVPLQTIQLHQLQPLQEGELFQQQRQSQECLLFENGTSHGDLSSIGVDSKKGCSKRNPWGSMSYADLITMAINSSPEKRLTLSQVYDWIALNIPYFKDKSDANSSAGWKNSIRHNLSLHNRFIRVQNEGTGKSSWWTLNPDEPQGGKPTRRRAASMQSSVVEDKRKRIRDRLKAIKSGKETSVALEQQNAMWNDLFPDEHILAVNALTPIQQQQTIDSNNDLSNFQHLSPGGFRQRASSNASSGGRLSPISNVGEVDFNESSMANMDLEYTNYNPTDTRAAEELAGNLANTVKIQEDSQLQQMNFGLQQQPAVPANGTNGIFTIHAPTFIPPVANQFQILPQHQQQQILLTNNKILTPSSMEQQQQEIPTLHLVDALEPSDINFDMIDLEEFLQQELDISAALLEQQKQH